MASIKQIRYIQFLFKQSNITEKEDKESFLKYIANNPSLSSLNNNQIGKVIKALQQINGDLDALQRNDMIKKCFAKAYLYLDVEQTERARNFIEKIAEKKIEELDLKELAKLVTKLTLIAKKEVQKRQKNFKVSVM